MPSMASVPPPRHATPSSDEGGQKDLRSKRSCIAINCSDGSQVIFFRPQRPRSGSYAAVSPSHSPSPPPGPDLGSGSTSGPSPGDNEGSGPGGKTKAKRPVSMPARLDVYDSGIHAGQSHRSLPAYLHGRCTECGRLRGHSDSCVFGNRLFVSSLTSSEARPSAPIPVLQVSREIHNNGNIEYQQTQRGRGPHAQGGTRTRTPQPQSVDVDHDRQMAGTIPRSPSSEHSETRRGGTPQLGRSANPGSSPHSRRTPSQNSRTPSPIQGFPHDHRTPPPPPHRSPTRNSRPGPSSRGLSRQGQRRRLLVKSAVLDRSSSRPSQPLLSIPPPPPPRQIPTRAARAQHRGSASRFPLFTTALFRRQHNTRGLRERELPSRRRRGWW
ncbi:hypothetical protein F4782DRAFT_251878 [Xylaria castorea]|nr:hypothetical protein F4782DRAFT_251878 [Xylaria castorea]